MYLLSGVKIGAKAEPFPPEPVAIFSWVAMSNTAKPTMPLITSKLSSGLMALTLAESPSSESGMEAISLRSLAFSTRAVDPSSTTISFPSGERKMDGRMPLPSSACGVSSGYSAGAGVSASVAVGAGDGVPVAVGGGVALGVGAGLTGPQATVRRSREMMIPKNVGCLMRGINLCPYVTGCVLRIACCVFRFDGAR